MAVSAEFPFMELGLRHMYTVACLFRQVDFVSVHKTNKTNQTTQSIISVAKRQNHYRNKCDWSLLC